MKRFLFLTIILLFYGSGTNFGIQKPSQQHFMTESPPEKSREEPARDTSLNRQEFDQIILPSLHGLCKRCHRKYFDKYAKVLTLVAAGDPEKSKLYQMAKGENGHPEVWPSGSQELDTLKKWILGEPLLETP